MLDKQFNNLDNTVLVVKSFYKNKPKDCNSSKKNNRPPKPNKESIQATRQ